MILFKILNIHRSKQCSTECGTGQQLRTIFCDRSPPNTDRCDYRMTPDANRECTSNSKCIGEWFLGEWSMVCFEMADVKWLMFNY